MRALTDLMLHLGLIRYGILDVVNQQLEVRLHGRSAVHIDLAANPRAIQFLKEVGVPCMALSRN